MIYREREREGCGKKLESGRLIIRRGVGKERGRRRSTTLPMDQTNSPFYQRITKKACYLFNTIIQTNKKLQHPAREVSLLFYATSLIA